MKLVDKVAQFIYDGHKQLTDKHPGTTVAELYKHTKQVTDCPHPQRVLKLQYTVNLGDVYRPRGVAIVPNIGEPIVLFPNLIYVVYQISHLTPTYNLSTELNSETYKHTPKFILLNYLVEGTDTKFDLLDIESVVCIALPMILTGILDECDLVGNVADQLI